MTCVHPGHAECLTVGDPPVGEARLRQAGRRLSVDALWVLPQARGRGWGTMLLFAAGGLAFDRDLELLLPDGAEAARHTSFLAQVAGRLPRPAPRPAVSVIPVRDGADGLEAFVQHRVATMDFAAGALVFPGGRIDPGDTAAGAVLTIPRGLPDDHSARWLPSAGRETLTPADSCTILATAVREVAEETGARLDPARLQPWDRWVTPIGYSRRFDVRFLLYPVTGAEARDFGHTTTEAHRSEWLPIREIVCRAETGALSLLPPTRTIVDELAALGSVGALLARQPRIVPVEHDLTARRPRPSG